MFLFVESPVLAAFYNKLMHFSNSPGILKAGISIEVSIIKK